MAERWCSFPQPGRTTDFVSPCSWSPTTRGRSPTSRSKNYFFARAMTPSRESDSSRSSRRGESYLAKCFRASSSRAHPRCGCCPCRSSSRLYPRTTGAARSVRAFGSEHFLRLLHGHGSLRPVFGPQSRSSRVNATVRHLQLYFGAVQTPAVHELVPRQFKPLEGSQSVPTSPPIVHTPLRQPSPLAQRV